MVKLPCDPSANEDQISISLALHKSRQYTLRRYSITSHTYPVCFCKRFKESCKRNRKASGLYIDK